MRTPLPAGWRLATGSEVAAEQALRERRMMHGSTSDESTMPAAEYVLAFTLALRTLDVAAVVALNAAALGPGDWLKRGRVTPLRSRESVDVESEMAAMLTESARRGGVAGAAYLGWRLTWLHPFTDGCGRTSRAAAYAMLLAGNDELRAAHGRRIGARGTRTLTVPERIERDRARYIRIMNAAHDSGRVGAFTLYLAELAEEQIAGVPSREQCSCEVTR